ncbi:MAG: hypothetical protein LN566_07495 [Rickettsia endosymbiont of Stiretrus anchorago]|nr:hypothetical protein [Rickettsia endosymbiont of Stiretrus anchorago]
MSNTKFSKPPLSSVEKEKKAEEFLSFIPSNNNIVSTDVKSDRIMKKEPVKHLALRFPKTLADDVTEISAITGLSINAVCIELLRPVAKIKLKELK